MQEHIKWLEATIEIAEQQAPVLVNALNLCLNDAKQKLEMEKEQIKDAFVECWKSNVPEGIECKLDAEQYYNTTFKQE